MKLDDQSTPTDYDHAQPLDVHRWSDYPEVNRFVDRLYELLCRKHHVRLGWDIL